MGKKLERIPETNDELVAALKEAVPPYTDEQMRKLEKNHKFYSPYDSYKEKNGMSFRIVREIYDDPGRRENFGFECSTAWLGEDGEILESRFFDVVLEDGTEIEAELEELDGYHRLMMNVAEARKRGIGESD